MKTKLIFSIIFLILVMPLVFAETETYQVNTPIELKFICTLNNEIPTSASYNITISYPNGTSLISNQNTTALGNGAFSYITIFPEIGLYSVQSFCWDGNYSYSDTDFYEITPTGNVQNVSQGIASFGYLILMFSLTIMFGWMGFKFSESDKLWVLGILLIFLSILFVVYDVWLGYEYHRNYTGAASSDMPETIFYIFMFSLVAGLIVTTIVILAKWERIYKWIKREMQEKQFNLEEDEIDRSFKL